MSVSLSCHRRLLTAGLALGTTALVLPAAQATPLPSPQAVGQVINDADLTSAGCTPSGETANGTGQSDIALNAAPRTLTVTGAETGTSADPSDHVTSTSAIKASVRLRARGGTLTNMDLTFTGTGSSVSNLATSTCTVRSQSLVGMIAPFTVSRPTVVEFSGSATGIGGTAYGVGDSPGIIPGSPDSAITDTTRASTGRLTFVVSAGTHYALIGGLIDVAANRTVASKAGAGSIHVTLRPAGARTASSGHATYVTMPTARSCSTHSVNPKITGKKEQAQKIKSVSFFVNGKKAGHAKHPHKGKQFSLRATDNTPITVTAKATVRVRVHKHKFRTRTITSTASYLQCS